MTGGRRRPTPARPGGREELAARLEAGFAGPVLVAALMSLPAIWLKTSPGGSTSTAGAVLSWAAWCVFALEWAVLLAVTDDRARWLRGHALLTVVLALSLPLLPSLLELAQLLLGAKAVKALLVIFRRTSLPTVVRVLLVLLGTAAVLAVVVDVTVALASGRLADHVERAVDDALHVAALGGAVASVALAALVLVLAGRRL